MTANKNKPLHAPVVIEICTDEFEAIDENRRNYFVRPLAEIGELWRGQTIELQSEDGSGQPTMLFAWVLGIDTADNEVMLRPPMKIREGYGLVSLEVIPVGRNWRRLYRDSNASELAFVRAWIKELSHSSRGYNLLDMLLHPSRVESHTATDAASSQDHHVAMTLTQWMGSNVGLSFVRNALRGAGYEVSHVEVTKQPER